MMAVNRSRRCLAGRLRKIQRQAAHTVRRAIEELPVDVREVIVLRELEGMSYKDIAAVVGIPVGMVMSRLARGRERLLVILASPSTLEGHRDVS